MTESPRLLLIDGSGFIFRAYHKLPPLTRADGTPTGAVYGFTTMLLKLREELQASHAVVVFDAASKTFRNEIYDRYKANRPPPPEDLVPQFPLVREAAKALTLPVIEQLGVEADDVIATYTKEAKTKGMEVCIVSSDKDLMQLIGQGVSIFDPMKNAMLQPADVEAKFGVSPDKIVEVQSLIGDSVDNVPGVPGIGPKTAAELILHYGTLENLLAHTHEIKQAKRRETLETYRDQALLSKRLVTLKEDCIDLPPIEEYIMQSLDVVRCVHFCEDMGFKSIARRIEQKQGKQPEISSSASAATSSAVQAVKTRHYHLVQDKQQLQQLIERIRQEGKVAFDTETTSLDATQASLVGIALSLKAGEGYYIPLQHKKAGSITHDLFHVDNHLLEGQIVLEDALAMLKPMLEDASILKIGHNIKYDCLIMQHYGITVYPLEDTMLLSYCLGAGLHQHNLDELAQRYLDIKTITFHEVAGSGKGKTTFDYVPLDKAGDYAAEDADITMQLYQHFKPELLQQHMATLYERIERALIPVIVRMEAHGIRVDRKQLSLLSSRFSVDMQKLEEQIYALAGQSFNIGSPKQLGEVLFDAMGLGKGKKSSKSGAYVTDAETLEELALSGHELPAKVLEWRQLSKLKSTYSDALVRQIHPVTGRVHTSYSLAATSTGRLSSSEPNLQNIPIRTEQGKLIRQAFIAEEGFTLMSADYSQIELRLLAHVADIPTLKEAFKEGRDIHTITAAQVFGVEPEAVDNDMRRKAKMINFGIIYGISAHGLSTRLGIPRGLAAEYIDAYFRQYPGIRHYMEHTKEQARAQGYVTTLWGRRCHVPMILEKNPNRRAFAERAAINAPLQGSAADIIKLAMIAVDRLLTEKNARSRMLLQVHDELVFEIAAGEEHLIPLIQKTMEQVAQLEVPLVVETGTGQHWGEAH